MDELKEQFNFAVNRLVNKVDLKFWQMNQKNFSEEINEIYEKVDSGKELSGLDVYILLTEDKEKINNYKRFCHIKECLNNKSLTENDLDYLINLICDEKTEEIDLLKEQYSKFLKQ